MDCRERAGVTGIQELQQVECLAGPDLTQDDSVWRDEAKPSKDRGSIRLGRRFARGALRTGRDSSEAGAVPRCLDEDDPLVLGMNLASAAVSVDLPLPVPPQIKSDFFRKT